MPSTLLLETCTKPKLAVHDHNSSCLHCSKAVTAFRPWQSIQVLASMHTTASWRQPTLMCTCTQPSRRPPSCSGVVRAHVCG
jgi:hypothetical protein